MTREELDEKARNLRLYLRSYLEAHQLRIEKEKGVDFPPQTHFYIRDKKGERVKAFTLHEFDGDITE